MGIGDTALFGKYRLCRVLGRGRSATVFLAEHTALEEYRAIKRVSKSRMDYERFRKEALMLKRIRHPGIPMVYDLEEDENFYYLIEEFLEGDSLYALISEKGHFSKAMTICCGIQICYLVSILHSVRPYPVLYLDLQPKNLLVCHDTVKLVDFDHAVYLHEANDIKKRYGTVGCAAPEQYTEEALSERTDIYAIGAVLHYMMTGTFPEQGASREALELDGDIGRIVEKCLRIRPEERYGSAQQVGWELEKLQEAENQSGRLSFLEFIQKTLFKFPEFFRGWR